MSRLLWQHTAVSGGGGQGAGWRAVALPAEHGSWSLVLEPIVLGLLVAPSWAGLFMAVAGFFTFLLQRPFKIAITDYQRGRQYARTPLARRAVLIYGCIATAALFTAVALGGWALLWPLLAAVPLLLIYVFYDRRRGRQWQAELAGPAAFAAISAMIALAGGWPPAPALALWGAMAARSVPAVLYVRARLRLAKSKPAAASPAILAHVLALALVLSLAWLRLLPALAVVPFILLLLRALLGLSPWRLALRTQTLGWLEVLFGFLTVLLIAAGYWLQ